MAWITRVAVYLTVLTGATAVAQQPGPYPAHWWAFVPDDQKAVWEVLPQAAKRPLELCGRTDAMKCRV
jgi:hypothetical protein